jgi:hypothetical protein
MYPFVYFFCLLFDYLVGFMSTKFILFITHHAGNLLHDKTLGLSDSYKPMMSGIIVQCTHND